MRHSGRILFAAVLLASCMNAQVAPSSPSSPTATSDASLRLPRPDPSTFPVPASCPAPAPVPAVEGGFPAFWLYGNGLRAGIPGGLLYEGGNKIQWQTETVADLSVDADQQGSSAGFEITLQRIGPTTYPSETVFKAPGCWRLRASAGTQRLESLVYVYPEGCRPPGRTPRPVLGCHPPAA